MLLREVEEARRQIVATTTMGDEEEEARRGTGEGENGTCAEWTVAMGSFGTTTTGERTRSRRRRSGRTSVEGDDKEEATRSTEGTTTNEGRLNIVWRLKGNRLSLLFEGELEGDASVVSAMAREWDLVRFWNGFVVRSDVIAERESGNSMTVSAEIWLPWPFRNRIMVVESRNAKRVFTTRKGAERDGAFFVSLRSGDTSLADPEGKRAAVTMEGGLMLSPIDARRTKATMLVHLSEERMHLVPNWLLNQGMKVYTPKTFTYLNKIVRETSRVVNEARRRRGETDNRLDRGATNERTKAYAVPKRGAEIRKKKMTDPELIAAMSSRILRDVENYEDFVMTHVRRMFETNAEEEEKANDEDGE